MITSLIVILIAALVLLVIHYVASMFIGGNILKILDLILFLVFLVYALRQFGIASL